MGETTIEWTNKTWNPIRGCSVVSEGCRNCYAMNFATRFAKAGEAYEGLAYRNESGAHWTGKVVSVPGHLEDPLHWRQPKRVFVNSMSDLFHESIPREWIDQVFEVMFKAKHHVFQILTKRPARMLDHISRSMWLSNDELPNVWLGVSVEDQNTADERIPLLMETPAAVRWISAEPLLGPIDLESVPTMEGSIDWVVVGGESGPGARPMHPDWARSIRDQCVDAGVPFFFKQWGNWLAGDGDGKNPAIWQDGNIGIHPLAERDSVEYFKFGAYGEPGSFALKLGKKTAGRLLDGRTWDEYPHVIELR